MKFKGKFKYIIYKFPELYMMQFTTSPHMATLSH